MTVGVMHLLCVEEECAGRLEQVELLMLNCLGP